MTWFTANQVSVNNGSTILTVTSGEDISNIRAGDALIVGSFAPVEINRAYVDGSNNKIIELKSAWSDSNQSNAAARVFPTAGGFKEATNALRAATQLTSDQFQTLTDWGTTNGTVTFTDSSGQQYTARSLSKMDADVAAVQAQAESLVGSVVLPTKADFEARHEGKYAGAGFVEWGTEDGISFGGIVELSETSANNNQLSIGTNGTDDNYSEVYLSGSKIRLHTVARADGLLQHGRSFIKYPSAPDGLDKADGTGRFTSLAEAITAGGTSLSASVIHRQDLCILESWDEDISEKGNVLYPYGNVQYGGSWSGITLATSHVAQGYSAFFVGDTTTTGKGFILDLTNDNHVKFLQDKDNNCYTDNGKIIQRRYRIRTIAGLEGTWHATNTEEAALTFSGGGNKNVTPQGSSVEPKGLKDGRPYYAIDTQAFKANSTGIWKAEGMATDALFGDAYNGFCVAVPICLVQRRNQGAYHPVYNLAGSNFVMSNSGSDSAAQWYISTVKDINNISQCFDFFLAAGTNTTGNNSPFADGVDGRIGTVSGRPDGYFYDAIYASDVLDLRMSAHKKSPDEVLRESWQDAISGKVRGWEAQPLCRVQEVVGVSGITLTVSGNVHYGSNSLWESDTVVGWFINNNGDIVELTGDASHTPSGDQSKYVFTEHTFTGTSGYIIATHRTQIPYYQAEPTWTDIIADPSVLAATFPEGVGGSWIPVIPDGVSQVYKYTKKLMVNSVAYQNTGDNGSSFMGGTLTDNNLILNTRDSTIAPGNLQLRSYKSKANFTESASLGVVNAMGEMFATNHNDISYGCLLMSSVLGKVATESSGSRHVLTQYLTDFTYQYTGKLLPDIATYPANHNVVDIKNITQSPTLKAFAYATDNNGIQAIQIPFKEMVWDSGAGTVITVSSNAAYSYESGKVYKLDHADFRNLEGTFWQFKIDTTNTASQIADSLEAHLQGVLSESGVARLWDGNGFGDNNKFEITNGVKNMLDQNGNTILYGTHQFNTKYWSYN